MELFMEQLTTLQDMSSTFTVLDVVLSLLWSFLLTAYIWWIYKITHRGTSYTQSYVQTLVVMSMIVALIMLIVWSNIARAFSLVWALSIIRFRNAVKETRDVGFIFLAMAIWMAMWTKFYLLGIIATVFITIVIVIMNRFDRYSNTQLSQILKIQLTPDVEFSTLFDDLFLKYTSCSYLVSIDSVRSGALIELIYTINLKDEKLASKLIHDIKKRTNNLKVTLVTGYNTTDL